MAVDPGNVVRCTVRFDLAGETMINVWEFQNVGEASPDNETVFDALADMFDTAYSYIDSAQSEDVAGIDLKVDKVVVQDGKKVILENIGQGPFADDYLPIAEGDRLPSTVAALMKFLTAHGKSFGRKFIGGFMEGGSVGDAIDEPILGALLAMAEYLLMYAPEGSGWALVPGVLSLGKLTAGSFFEFLAAEIDAVWSTQRRRRPGTGI